MSHNVLFIGLGVMGYPMAGHLSKQFPTWVYNRTLHKAQAWASVFTGSALDTLHILPQRLDVIITCIGNDQDLKQVYLSDSGLLEQCAPGTLLIDHTTASAELAATIGALAREKGLEFIDAPVSGGEQGAINGQLSIMCGGSEASFLRALPLLNCYAKAVSLMGPHGAGQLTKMANQIAVAGVLQGLAEAIHFAEQAGLDCQHVIDVISKGAAQSWQMENRSTRMIRGEYNYGFAVDLMRKDLNICLSEARKCGAKLPLAALIDQFYADVQALGGNRWDTSSLLERLRPRT